VSPQSSPKSPGRRVDLNAAHKARREAGATEGPVVELGDLSFVLPVSLPASVPYGLSQMANGEAEGFGIAVKALFGDRVLEALAAGLEVEDLNEIAALYGEDPGNSSASGSS
jgi:hypothetical protein